MTRARFAGGALATALVLLALAAGYRALSGGRPAPPGSNESGFEA